MENSCIVILIYRSTLAILVFLLRNIREALVNYECDTWTNFKHDYFLCLITY